VTLHRVVTAETDGSPERDDVTRWETDSRANPTPGNRC
jgi:hypothetical protein